MVKKFIICRGIQGSGKSTWSKRYVKEHGSDKWMRVNNDDIRNMLGDYWVTSRERIVSSILNHAIQEGMSKGMNIIVDNMNLNEKTCAHLEHIVEEYNSESFDVTYEVEYKDFFITLEEAILRDSLRPNPIGEAVIRKTYKTYRRLFYLSDDVRPKYNGSKYKEDGDAKRSAVILDLDGTVALNEGDREWYGEDAERGYLQDTLHEGVADVVRTYCQFRDYDLIVLTGREDTELGREMTLKWLDNNYLYPTKLIMRPKGDYRKDFVVKEEQFKTIIEPEWYVHVVFEDRQKVVDMWRNLGLLCLQPWISKF